MWNGTFFVQTEDTHTYTKVWCSLWAKKRDIFSIRRKCFPLNDIALSRIKYVCVVIFWRKNQHQSNHGLLSYIEKRVSAIAISIIKSYSFVIVVEVIWNFPACPRTSSDKLHTSSYKMSYLNTVCLLCNHMISYMSSRSWSRIHAHTYLYTIRPQQNWAYIDVSLIQKPTLYILGFKIFDVKASFSLLIRSRYSADRPSWPNRNGAATNSFEFSTTWLLLSCIDDAACVYAHRDNEQTYMWSLPNVKRSSIWTISLYIRWRCSHHYQSHV